jgi:hypothetical protein
MRGKVVSCQERQNLAGAELGLLSDALWGSIDVLN